MNKHKILIVEDDHAIRYSLEKFLDYEGYEVISARDGDEGLKLALKHKPALILLGLLLPKLKGDAMLSRLRKYRWGKDAKVIIFTSYDKPRSIFESLVVNDAIHYVVRAQTDLKQLSSYIETALA